MALTTPIIGVTSLLVGASATFTNATDGGTWSSSNTSILTVNGSGVVIAVGVGNASVIYTVGDDSMSFTVGVYSQTITNGFNVTEIFPAFQGRIGWLDTDVEGAPALDSVNTSSTSARYYNDGSAHPAVTIKNIYDCQENKSITDEAFNELLRQYDKSVIMRCLNSVFNRPALIEHKLCYTRTYNNLAIQIPNGGNFVGWRINIAKGDYAVMFNAISLYFNGDTTFNLYMYNDLKKAPLKVQSVTCEANNQTQVSLDWVVNYITTRNLGGVIFIGYYQEDLGNVQALDEQLNLWENPKIFGGYPCQAAQVGSGDTRDFNRGNPSVVYRTYGLNLEVSTYRDYTQKIIMSPHLFDDVRMLSMAILIVSIIKNSGRINGTERIAGEYLNDLKIETDLAMTTQEMPFSPGLKAQLNKAIKQLNDNFWPKAQPASVPIDNSGCGIEYLGMDIRNLPPRQNFA